ncbi:Hypothetical protein FKW44_002661 [Caligus rogercresseyi]|uniref:Uncharacterized protein n=1 Tax=Caligus rogercresseyi TaxID=217165 RepID=A0A7T8KKH5_CALRO|nr:Hypothetical protein FKW44_002661 [Caligus rogercresseyi]
MEEWGVALREIHPCPTNHGVDNINNLMTRLFEGNARIYTSRDSVSENQHYTRSSS